MKKLDVRACHTIYEHNYQRLMKLLPQVRQVAEGDQFGLEGSEALAAEVVESHRYTTVLRMSHGVPLPEPVPVPEMTVRLYHDACVAEVTAYQRSSRFRVKYEYPNAEMHQVREKGRVNEFLGEWLEHLLHCRGTLQPFMLSDA